MTVLTSSAKNYKNSFSSPTKQLHDKIIGGRRGILNINRMRTKVESGEKHSLGKNAQAHNEEINAIN